jgi:Leucine-rich repeat (LRR) protein
LGKLKSRELAICDCDGLTQNLSPQIKALSQLETLKMTECEGKFLPKEIWQLPSIQSLVIHSTSVPTLPDIGEHLKNLTKLWIHKCDSLEYIQTKIWKLRNLKELRITHRKIADGAPK